MSGPSSEGGRLGFPSIHEAQSLYSYNCRLREKK